MTHVFKLQSTLADLFIYSITEDRITYEVRDKNDGKLLEPKRTSPYTVTGNAKIFFDGRDIDARAAAGIAHILNS